MNPTWLTLAAGAVADAVLTGTLSRTERVFIKRHVSLNLLEGDARSAELRARQFKVIERSPASGVIGLGVLMSSPSTEPHAVGVPILLRARPTAAVPPQPEALSRAEAVARYTLLQRLPSLPLPLISTEVSSLWGTPLAALSAPISSVLFKGLEEEGESLSLAGAISALSCYLGGDRGALWAASGGLSAEGEVRAVEGLTEKLTALLQSGARPRYTLISEEQRERCHEPRWAPLNLRSISTLDQLIALLWPEAWEQRRALPQTPLVQVARQALAFEQRQEHSSALLMARYLEPLLEGAEPADALEARVSCGLIQGTEARYQGDTLTSYARYTSLARDLDQAPSAVRLAALSRSLEERVTLKRASAMTSLFACEEARSLCEPIRAQPSSQRSLMEALGLSARAARLQGHLEEAEALSRAQLTLYFRPEERAERARCLYNHTLALIASYEAQRYAHDSHELEERLDELRRQTAEMGAGRSGLHARHVQLLSWRWSALQARPEMGSLRGVFASEDLLGQVLACVSGGSPDPLLARAALRLFARRAGALGEACALLAWARWFRRVTACDMRSSIGLDSALTGLTQRGLTRGLSPVEQRELRERLEGVELNLERLMMNTNKPHIARYPDLIMAYHCLTLAELRGAADRDALIKLFEASLASWGPFGERYSRALQGASADAQRAQIAGFCY